MNSNQQITAAIVHEAILRAIVHLNFNEQEQALDVLLSALTEINFNRSQEAYGQQNGCWLWMGPRFSTGYGLITWQGKGWKAHRLIWTLLRGPIPEKTQVLHHCDTPLCVNVEKCLFLGTDKDNHQDKAAKGRPWQQKKTHCPQGHPYSPENTYHPPQGGRQCCICKGLPPRKVVA